MARAVFAGLDQGTSGTRCCLYDEAGALVATAYERSGTHHPRPGWDEQSGDELLGAIELTLADALAQAGDVSLVAIGLANQGESVIAFDRVSGEPLSPAVLWSDRRGSELVGEVAANGGKAIVEARSGLPLDPYFSASKIAWLYRELPEVKAAAAAGRLAVGTLDAFFAFRLSGGEAFQTDPSTASRTQLMNLETRRFDPECAAAYGLDLGHLPEIVPSVLPTPLATSLGAPLWASVCDQPAALAAIGGVRREDIKVTHGTGCFIEANVGPEPLRPGHGLIPICGWELAGGEATYAIEGGVFSAATAVDWLVTLGIAGSASEVDRLAARAGRELPLFLPAFTGLGSPWWRPGAAGVFGRLRASCGREEFAAAVLDGIAQRVVDVLEAVEAEQGLPSQIRADGGLAASRELLQREADLSGCAIVAARDRETTAAGAAAFAAIAVGALDLDTLAARVDLAPAIEPSIDGAEREQRRRDWREFVAASAELDPDRPGVGA